MIRSLRRYERENLMSRKCRTIAMTSARGTWNGPTAVLRPKRWPRQQPANFFIVEESFPEWRKDPEHIAAYYPLEDELAVAA